MAAGFLELAAAAPERLAVDDGTTTLTRRGLNERLNRVRTALGARSVGAGDPVALLAGNSSDYLVVLLAAATGGMPPVPVNWHLTAEEIAYVLGNAGARALFVDAEHAEAGRAAAGEAGIEVVVPLDGPGWEAFLADGRDEEPPADTPYAGNIYYTSGTTGRPKGTRMSMATQGVPVPAVLQGMRPLLASMGMIESTIHLVAGPMYHAGPVGMAGSAALVGAEVHVMPRFDPEEALASIDRHGVTNSLLVPTMFVRLLRLPDEVRARYDVTSLDRVIHTAAAMPIEAKRSMIEWWGPVLTDGYGASEIGAVCNITSEEWLQRPGSVGKPLPMFRLDIIDDDGRAVPQGDVGQIWITGLVGHDIEYLGEPEKTASVHRVPLGGADDGAPCFTLGDLGYLDEDGYLFLADRRVDLIISGGVNIYPAEIEGVLVGHPAVEDVGVFGIPDDEWGQAAKAAVQLRAGHEASPELEAEILRWLRERMAHYKVPRSVDFHDELPRYPTGKLYRRLLRDAYWPAPEVGTAPSG